MAIPKEALISILADGRIHSGSELGLIWGVSRTSIAKAIGKLDLHGLEIFRIRGRGYRLKEPLYLLNKKLILISIESELQKKIASLEIFHSIASTNTYLLEKLIPHAEGDDRKFHICMSEMQSSGKGSRGRKWVSPYGHNIYLSLSWKFAVGSNSLDGLSLVAGLAVLSATRVYGIKGVGLKWPNDLQIDSRKVGGILVEVRGEAHGVFHVVIGVGINLSLSTGAMSEVDQPWSCLAEHGFEMGSRNDFAGQLITSLVRNIEEFQITGFSKFQSDWSEFDVMHGKEIEIVSQSGSLYGRSVGVDKYGALKVETANGVQVVRSGYVSLRIRSEM
jgi:BirA family transcriptional regulator, biotin operon repressor / biotin---[acetyl-CoA-carboxylase] ligase